MPLGIAIGRYSEHVKISTECYDDDDVTPDKGLDDEQPWPVQFIGQQNIPLYNSKNISGMMNHIYNKNYSRINSLINLKKYKLDVSTSGISVYHASSSKKNGNNGCGGGVSGNLFMNYATTDILLVTTDYQHDELFAVIFYGPLRNCIIHLFLCNNDDDVRNIMHKCNEEFARNKEIKQIDRSTYSDGLEIIHYKPYENQQTTNQDVLQQQGGEIVVVASKPGVVNQNINNAYNLSKENVTNKTTTTTAASSDSVNPSLQSFKALNTPMIDITQFRIPYGRVDVKEEDDDSFNNFGAFQTVQCAPPTVATTTTTARSIDNSVRSPPVLSGISIQTPTPATRTSRQMNLLEDDELEDEFAELALKRNIYMPEHMQDKSIENTLLFQSTSDPFSPSHHPGNAQNMKPGFFSSYNKLQS